VIGIERLRQLVAEAAERHEEIESALLELEESRRELKALHDQGASDAAAD
jgi:hypothetical protein